MVAHNHDWAAAQKEEAGFWGTCSNTLGEEMKQLVYAKYMGITFYHDGNSPYAIALLSQIKILDVGGGPVSLLLKTNVRPEAQLHVADPCLYPGWVARRYKECEIGYKEVAGENLLKEYVRDSFDEIWMYNVLQHVDKPEIIIENIYKLLKPGGIFRFFDWIESPANEAHPHVLTAADMIEWMCAVDFKTVDGSLDGEQRILDLSENGAVGRAFAGWVKK